MHVAVTPCAVLESKRQLSLCEQLTKAHLLQGGAGKVHAQVNVGETLYMQAPYDGSAAGSLASPAWNGSHE